MIADWRGYCRKGSPDSELEYPGAAPVYRKHRSVCDETSFYSSYGGAPDKLVRVGLHIGATCLSRREAMGSLTAPMPIARIARA